MKVECVGGLYKVCLWQEKTAWDHPQQPQQPNQRDPPTQPTTHLYQRGLDGGGAGPHRLPPAPQDDLTHSLQDPLLAGDDLSRSVGGAVGGGAVSEVCKAPALACCFLRALRPKSNSQICTGVQSKNQTVHTRPQRQMPAPRTALAPAPCSA